MRFCGGVIVEGISVFLWGLYMNGFPLLEKKEVFAAITVLWLTAFCLPASAQVERISVGVTGEQADGDSSQAAVSDNGQVVAFRTAATNIVTKVNYVEATFGWPNILVRDLTVPPGTLEQASGTVQFSVSVPTLYIVTDNMLPSISDDGQLVTIHSTLNFGSIPTLYNRSSGIAIQLLRGTHGDHDAASMLEPVISGNGRYVALYSLKSLLYSNPAGSAPINDDRNGTLDVFVYDWSANPVIPVERVSRDALGVEGNGDSLSPSLSDDGRYVAFYSYADNLVAGDTNGFEDVFVKDRQTAGIVMASVASDGTLGNNDSYKPIISGNGGFVVYRSKASNLVANDTNKHWDIFVHDLTLGTTERVSVSSSGTEANHDSLEADISDDGRFVVFRSNASNLVPADTNQRFDIFVHDRQTGQTERVSLPPSGEANNNSYSPVISGDGNWIVFESDATNLVADDTNNSRDIFRVPNPLSSTP